MTLPKSENSCTEAGLAIIQLFNLQRPKPWILNYGVFIGFLISILNYDVFIGFLHLKPWILNYDVFIGFLILITNYDVFIGFLFQKHSILTNYSILMSIIKFWSKTFNFEPKHSIIQNTQARAMISYYSPERIQLFNLDAGQSYDFPLQPWENSMSSFKHSIFGAI